MRTEKEIMEYLVIGRETEIEKDLIKDAILVEEKYATEIANGTIGYGIVADYESSPFILEDEDIATMEKVEQIGGIIVYSIL